MNGVDYYQGYGTLCIYVTMLPTSAVRTLLTGKLSREEPTKSSFPKDRELGFHHAMNRKLCWKSLMCLYP